MLRARDHGAVELHKLHGEVEVALDIGGVDDIDDGIRARGENEVAADDLLAGIGRQRVDAGQVRDDGLGMSLDLAVLAVDRDAGEVAHMLVRARELVEQRGLSAILVARQRELQWIARGNGMLAGTRAIGLLAQRGVRGGAAMDLLALLRVRIMDVLERDARGVRPTQGEFVAAQTDLDGIAWGRTSSW